MGVLLPKNVPKYKYFDLIVMELTDLMTTWSEYAQLAVWEWRQHSWHYATIRYQLCVGKIFSFVYLTRRGNFSCSRGQSRWYLNKTLNPLIIHKNSHPRFKIPNFKSQANQYYRVDYCKTPNHIIAIFHVPVLYFVPINPSMGSVIYM